MGRKNQPLFQHKNGTWYARWYVDDRKIAFSLDTTDHCEAMSRFTIVKQVKMGWKEYQKTISGWQEHPESTIKSIATKNGLVTIDPPQKITTDKNALRILLESAHNSGATKFNKETGEWEIIISGDDGDFVTQLNTINKALTTPPLVDKYDEIESFYMTAVQQMFIDKKAADRFARIWLQFLKEKKIVSWEQINDTLMQDFKLWRKATAITTKEHPNRKTKPPSDEVVKRHLQYISKSFELAVSREFLRFNPLKFWQPEKYHRSAQEALTIKELLKVFTDDAWEKNFITCGDIKYPLHYSFLDVVLLLFVTCKRRSEICRLRIENINFKYHYGSYSETKNKSKSNYSIAKAFFLTQEMEKLLKKVISNRKKGYVFDAPLLSTDKIQNQEKHLNPDLLSETFDDVCKRVVPEKKIPIKNLRQTATQIFEHAAFTEDEQDKMLGHYKVSTALPFYQDQSADAVARRLSKFTEKGSDILCQVVKKCWPC